MKLAERDQYRSCAVVVVPADDKENARLIVSQAILDAFNELDMAYPKTSAKHRRELKSIHQQLMKAG